MNLTFIRLTTIVTIVSLSLSAISCSKRHDIPGNKTTIQTKIGKYEAGSNNLPGDDKLTDLTAFLFADGILVKTYEFETPSGNYTFSVDERSGNLYVIGTSNGEITLPETVTAGMSETDWLASTSEISGEPVQFYTGMVSLENTSAPSNVASVVLTRGLARFDLAVESLDEVQVQEITFRNLAHSFNVFPSEDITSPSDAKRKDVTIVFDNPVTVSSEGILYAAEQVNESLEVSVKALVGGAEKTMTKVLSGNIKRNTVYKLTVRQDKIDLNLDLTFGEWEDGGNTDITVTSII